ncbi:MAG TPA: asparagine synthase (glutamine-hydrolyzing) [Ferruginibacter sp.]|jgi:asparagine synthase (glutamine-hydrolysing)|nr:asparagine synthase (glutamine-hydrolyzing) [Ferruginibacter sp.]
MCRVAGVINKLDAISSTEGMVKEMCQLLKHGGPDDEGIYTNAANNFVLGHRRLSLIDLSPKGHQPMSYADNRYYISYNGELYNYLELKEELKKAGYCFHSGSDTEVMLAAFAAWGTRAFIRFNGMFAFALWDNNTNDLYLVRDSIGMKPIYYAHTAEGFAFASEINAFKAIPYLREKNNQSQVYLMAYGHLPEPITTLKEVKPLEKGTWLKYHVPSSVITEINVFKQFSYLEKIDNREEAIHLIKESLQASVQRHLLSDAPIGVFLSGGIDSSIITLLANKMRADLQTVSIFLKDNGYSEKKYQDILQQNSSFTQHQHLLTETDFHNHLPEIMNAMDLPSCDGINTWFISKYAKENGLKAVLSGVGSDELYGGYPSFDRIQTTLLLQQLPNKVLKVGVHGTSKKLRRMAYLSIDGPIGKYLFLRGQFVPLEIAKYLDANEAEVWRILSEEPQLKNIDHLTPGNQASWLETNLYMQNQLLRDADVMSMAHGVEIRLPFLDVPFVDLSLRIDSTVKYSGSRGKQLLIDAFKDILPEQIWNRPKMGFAFPFKEWLGDDRYVKSRNGKYMGEYISKMRSGNMHWSQFFTLLLIEK